MCLATWLNIDMKDDKGNIIKEPLASVWLIVLSPFIFLGILREEIKSGW